MPEAGNMTTLRSSLVSLNISVTVLMSKAGFFTALAYRVEALVSTYAGAFLTHPSSSPYCFYLGI